MEGVDLFDKINSLLHFSLKQRQLFMFVYNTRLKYLILSLDYRIQILLLNSIKMFLTLFETLLVHSLIAHLFGKLSPQILYSNTDLMYFFFPSFIL